jgi:hypothetical protein
VRAAHVALAHCHGVDAVLEEEVFISCRTCHLLFPALNLEFQTELMSNESSISRGSF